MFDPELGLVRVCGWGFWTPTVSASFAFTVAEVCKASPKGASLLMDMTQLKPLREEGQQAFGALLGLLRGLGIGKTTVATASHLTRLQLMRLVAEHGVKGSIQFTTADAGSAGARDGRI